MNENIKNLVSKVKTDTSGKWISIDDVNSLVEQVVQECIKVVDETASGNQEINVGIVFASAAIVSHFGVEE